jgi:hypothetical protein
MNVNIQRLQKPLERFFGPYFELGICHDIEICIKLFYIPVTKQRYSMDKTLGEMISISAA